MSLLEAITVSKAFGGIRALDTCSITVEQGSITGLIGPNGSGKTTLFNVITGMRKPIEAISNLTVIPSLTLRRIRSSS